jgi:uncharacterized protein YodC (DUF2158 family)
MKFELGQRVRIKSTGKDGKITSYRIDGYYLKGEVKEIIQYSVNTGTMYDNYFKEDSLEAFNTYEFDKKFETGLVNLMIDINLDHENYNMVKNFADIKQSLSE